MMMLLLMTMTVMIMIIIIINNNNNNADVDDEDSNDNDNNNDSDSKNDNNDSKWFPPLTMCFNLPHYDNPLSHKGDQHPFSPNNISRSSGVQVMRTT